MSASHKPKRRSGATDSATGGATHREATHRGATDNGATDNGATDGVAICR